MSNGPTSGAEFFSVAAYGVAASPRVGSGLSVPRGGGYYKVGSPYTVAGRRYFPTETPQRVQKGRASWYGAAFHGRKTANGEIYDMNHLTAAHKTMPLPSYARVTNLQNNHTIVVRVNDRGPFS
ncbi:MAG: septal ring lytic transglycosylase RlpA family protein, partial [Pseudomonadota bacterium]